MLVAIRVQQLPRRRPGREQHHEAQQERRQTERCDDPTRSPLPHEEHHGKTERHNEQTNVLLGGERDSNEHQRPDVPITL